jgi:cytochrome c6
MIPKMVCALLSIVVTVVLLQMARAARKPDSKAGAALFASSCEVCHPGGGNTTNKAKLLNDPGFAKRYPADSQVMAVIRKGVPNTAMLPYTRQQMTDDQVSDVVAYIRTLAPAAKSASPARGSTLNKTPPKPARR